MSARSCAILVKRDKIQDVKRVSWLFEARSVPDTVGQYDNLYNDVTMMSQTRLIPS